MQQVLTCPFYILSMKVVLISQTVQTMMKCSSMLHFIRVFTVCQGTRLGVCRIQMVKLKKFNGVASYWWYMYFIRAAFRINIITENCLVIISFLYSVNCLKGTIKKKTKNFLFKTDYR